MALPKWMIMNTLSDLFGSTARAWGVAVVVGTLCIPELGPWILPLVLVSLWIGISFVSVKSKS